MQLAMLLAVEKSLTKMNVFDPNFRPPDQVSGFDGPEEKEELCPHGSLVQDCPYCAIKDELDRMKNAEKEMELPK